MKFCPRSSSAMLCLFLAIFSFCSCSKDSDLLAEYTSLDEDILISRFVVNDNFQISISNNEEDENFEITVSNESEVSSNNEVSGENNSEIIVGNAVGDNFQVSSTASIVLDVLANDNLKNFQNVLIVETTAPSVGTVNINTDNTLSYSPTSLEASVDSFSYTTEFIKEDGSLGKETGIVNIEINSPSALRADGINFSVYGAIGDGQVDDTKAIQAAIDSEKSLVGTPGSTYRISGLIDIDQPGDQYIDWNGATVIVTSEVSQAFKLNKSRDVLTMLNLTVDGKDLLEYAFELDSSFDFTNVDVKNIYSNDTRAVAFRVDIQDASDFETMNLTNCDCTNIGSKGNGEIGDIIGVSKCLWGTLNDNSPRVTMNVTGGIWDGVWGDDGDLLNIDQTNNKYDHSSKFIFKDVIFKNWSRRAVKGRVSGLEFYNCQFISTNPSNPRLTGTPTAGVLVLMHWNITSFPNSTSRNCKVIGCTFDNTSGFDSKGVVPSRTEMGLIEDCTFINSDIAFYVRVGDFNVRNNTFSANGKVYGYGGFNPTGILNFENNYANGVLLSPEF